MWIQQSNNWNHYMKDWTNKNRLAKNDLEWRGTAELYNIQAKEHIRAAICLGEKISN